MERKFKFRLLLVGLLTLCATCLAPPASASSGGISGYSGKNGSTCTSCHDGGIQPTVVLTGPTSVNSGSTNAYTLTITGGSEIAGGLDVAADAGTFAVLDAIYTKLKNGELVHSQPKNADPTGAVTWSFNWTAPTVATDTNVVMYAAGNSVNLNGSTSGDNSNSQALTLSVLAAPVNQPPVANAGGPYSGIVGQSVQFDGSGSSDPNGDALSYSWNFGDATTGTGVNPTHTYSASGAYNVALTVSDGTLSSNAATVANIYAGATPTILRFHAPGHVGIRAGQTTTKSFSVTADILGAAPGTGQMCGTAYLLKNGIAAMNQPVCIIPGTRATVQFQYDFSASDSPSVAWETYVVVSGTESQRVDKTTLVKVR